MPTVLSPEEIQTQLATLSAWQVKDNTLWRQVTFPSFLQAISFVNALAHLAERQDHHPDIDIRYATVTIAYSTHSAGGITALDFSGAKETDGLIPLFQKPL